MMYYLPRNLFLSEVIRGAVRTYRFAYTIFRSVSLCIQVALEEGLPFKSASPRSSLKHSSFFSNPVFVSTKVPSPHNAVQLASHYKLSRDSWFSVSHAKHIA